MYISTAEVYRTAGITSSEVSELAINDFILDAEERVDRFTNTTYWAVDDSGTATSGAASTITDTNKTWNKNAYSEGIVWIYGGTGSGQCRKISSISLDTITVDRAWATNPDNTSTYRIIHTGKDAYVDGALRDGNATNKLFLDFYPLVVLEALTIDSVSVTPSNVYQYKAMGKLKLSNSAEKTRFPSQEEQLTEIDYWYGVFPFPREVKRLALLYAATATLSAQMGTTHNIPSTYSLPEGSVTVGQAYINIKGTWDTLMKEITQIEAKIIKYVSIV